MSVRDISAEAELTRLRAEHKVRPLVDDEEGLPVGRLPDGVYGFTYSPASDSVPLFAKKALQCYEIHKLPDGAVHLVGFLGEREASELQTSTQPLSLELFPDPWKESKFLVSLPFSRIVPSRKGPSRTDGNGLRLEVEPISASA